MNLMPGDIIISHPKWTDNEDVFFITEQANDAIIGIQLNASAKLTFRELVKEKGLTTELHAEIFHGGDVSPTIFLLLHDAHWYSSNTVIVNKEWSVTSDMNMIDKLIDGNTPNEYRCLLGLSAWEPVVLGKELTSTSEPLWLHLSNPPASIITADPEDQYKLALTAMSAKLWDEYF